MAQLVWLDRAAILKAHDEVIALTGGAPGIRDIGLLDSALARAENVHAYEGVDDVLFLAAVFAVAVAKNHPFVDGNKRAAFIAMVVLLGSNGFRLVASQDDASTTILAAAAGQVDIDKLAAWLRDNTITR